MIPLTDLESMEETLFWQAQPGVHDVLAAARCEAGAGQRYDETAVRRRYEFETTR
jgi:antitoxin YefM